MSNIKRERELANREPHELTTDELLELVRMQHTADEIPACRICGETLWIVRSGGGRVWACSGLEDDPENAGRLRRRIGRSEADDHYARSKWEQYRHTDPFVLELAIRYERAMKKDKV